MPDKDGKLSPDEKNLIVKKLQAIWAGPARNCPICGNPNWSLADHLVQPVTLGPDTSIMLGGIGYPQIMLISDGCGHTLFFNAVMIGILPSSGKEEGTPVNPVAGGPNVQP